MNLISGIQLTQILYFLEAVECGSLLKASEKLHLSQPALSASIRKLENLLGVQLLERSRAGVTLTNYGKIFFQHALNVVAELNSGVSLLELEKTQGQSQIAVGALPIATEPLLTDSVGRFKAGHPLVAVTIEPGTSSVLSPRLKLNELDMVLGYASTLEHESAFRFETLFIARLRLIARKGHPLERRKRVPLAKLNEYEWFIPYPYNEYRRYVTNIFTESRLEYPKNSLSASYHLAKSYLAASDAVAFLPYDFVYAEIKEGRLAMIDAALDLPDVRVGFAISLNKPRTETLNAFIAELRRAAGKLINLEVVLPPQ